MSAVFIEVGVVPPNMYSAKSKFGLVRLGLAYYISSGVDLGLFLQNWQAVFGLA